MDSKRMFLYFAIIVLGFLLWNTWQVEHASKATPLHTVATSTPNTTTTTTATATAIEAMPLVATQMIHVKTDVLDVSINTNDGSIEEVKLLHYPVSLKDKNDPLVLLNNHPDTLYVANSGLVNEKGEIKTLHYTATQNEFSLGNQSSLTVTLTAKQEGVTVTKAFTFKRDDYAILVHSTIQNTSTHVWQARLFNQIVRHEIAQDSPGMLHYSTFMGAALSSPESHYQKFSFANLAQTNINQTIQGGWLAMIQHYFISAWVPNADQSYQYFSRFNGNQTVTVGMMSPLITVVPQQATTVSSTFYIGPAIAKRLEQVAPNLNLTVDYGWLWFISVILFWLLSHIHRFIGNWGWSIVIVTLFIKILFYKLSATSYRSMANMRKLQPKIAALKERFGNDRQKLGQATMELYKKEKVNPLGGCLPIIVQIPVFFALYYVLIESVQLRQAPFMFWIHDLSQPDPYFILPILMGLSMFVQQKLSPAPPDPMQAKIMMLMPIIFTVFFFYFPAGLVLYWLVNNVVSLLQQAYITRRVEHPADGRKK